MKKRILSVVLVLSMMVSFMPIIASGATSGTCGDNLTWTLDNGTLTISGTGKMKDYDREDYRPASWYSNRKSIKNIVIEKGVTNISTYAFDGCSNLTNITISNSVTSIGGFAFGGCSSLTSITIPNSVTSIGSFAFSDCRSLTSITIPNSVTSIGSSAFNFCSSLTSITIPNSITCIDDSAFWGCSSLKSITIPDSVTSIGKYAFNGCSSLTSITIPTSVTNIAYRTFSYCKSLKSITIPNGVTSIGEYVFAGCSSLENIKVDDKNKYYSSLDGNLYNLDKTKLVQYSIGKTDKIFNIPTGVTSIDNYAFAGCSSLTSITIPNGVTGIGDSAFSECSGLTSITILNSVTSIGDFAFSYCSSLTSITIPKSVISIGIDAFKNCSSLKDVYYTGTREEWERIDIAADDYHGDNDDLLNATSHYNSATPSTIYSADKVSTQIVSGKLKIMLNVDDNISNATVYVAFRNNGKIVEVKKATLSNLQAEVSLSNKTYTDMNIYIWNSRQQPYTYVKNIKK